MGDKRRKWAGPRGPVWDAGAFFRLSIEFVTNGWYNSKANADRKGGAQMKAWMRLAGAVCAAALCAGCALPGAERAALLACLR